MVNIIVCDHIEEDTDAFCLILKKELKPKVGRVHCPRTCEELWVTPANNHIDIVVTNIYLPNCDCIEEIEKIHRKYPDVIFLFHTCDDSILSRLMAFIGASIDWILKDADDYESEVLHKMSRALEIVKQRKIFREKP